MENKEQFFESKRRSKSLKRRFRNNDDKTVQAQTINVNSDIQNTSDDSKTSDNENRRSLFNKRRSLSNPESG